jgi:N-acyl-D-aspartate/D-glutamate deacylase
MEEAERYKTRSDNRNIYRVQHGSAESKMKMQQKKVRGDIKYNVEWNTLGEYMNFLEKKGISPNIASFVGTVQFVSMSLVKII